MNQPTQVQLGDTTFDLDVPIGVHLVTRRHGYAHHGIYIGNGQVIHYAGLSRHPCGGPIEGVSIDCFAAGFGVAIAHHPCTRYNGPEAVRRAVSRLGECNYRLLTNNCEHFCLWCLFGVARSEQVEACLRNPVRAVAVIAILVVRALVGERKRAWPVHAAEGQVMALNLGA